MRFCSITLYIKVLHRSFTEFFCLKKKLLPTNERCCFKPHLKLMNGRQGGKQNNSVFYETRTTSSFEVKDKHIKGICPGETSLKQDLMLISIIP